MVNKMRYLDFEEPLKELDHEISKLKSLKLQGGVDVTNEIKSLERKSNEILKEIFAKLEPYQVVRLSRHLDRPTTLDYISMIFDDFFELKGDRLFKEDESIVGGLATFNKKTLMLIGHQKGRNTQENMTRNFGMPRPEGYRKALRLMKLAERFKIPLITFIDTPGAYPGLEAEERGQAQAIADNIIKMTELKVPILSIILGEGGSGGALAIAVADRMIMMEYSIYSVISPEGCAAITWKDGSFASTAAKALQLTSKEIINVGVADSFIKEPLGGAHRDPHKTAQRLKDVIEQELKTLTKLTTEELLDRRYKRYREIGAFERRHESSISA